jgi:ankyrin repeat protein
LTETNDLGRTPLHRAAAANALSTAKFLVNAGVPVDATGSRGTTPPHAVAGEGITSR